MKTFKERIGGAPVKYWRTRHGWQFSAAGRESGGFSFVAYESLAEARAGARKVLPGWEKVS